MSGENQIGISEDFRIAVQAALERFRLNEEEKNYEFPSALSKLERKFVHELCKEYGLKSKSHGKGANRSLTMAKRELVSRGHDLPPIKLKIKTQQHINNLLSHQPLMDRERNDLVPRTERGSLADVSVKESRKLLFKQPNIHGQIPPEANTASFEYFKQSLPIYHMKEHVLKSIEDNRVVLVLGDTGSGKSTQVPQMVLEEFTAKKKKCNIYVTQPRRLSAVALAERISTERSEVCGKSVGYQIRLEQKLSRDTILTFCTTGILLRTLMSGDDISHVTHIIVDEVHERDKFTDFLLIALRDLLFKQSHLKLILMSATLNLPLFTEYFGNCPVISVPGRMFDVKEYFLEDVLSWTSYSNDLMKMAEVRLSKQKESREALAKWCENLLPQSEPKTVSEDTETSAKMDELIENAFQHGKRDAIDDIISLVTDEKVSVDYQHSLTTVSGLMTAAARGWMNCVERFLRLGADVHLQTVNGWKALDFAHHYRSVEIAEWLSAFEIAEMGDDDQSELDNSTMDEVHAKLLKVYHYSFNDDKVDVDLILALTAKIHSEKPNGGILVFLPGYDDILSLKDRIEGSDSFPPSNTYKIFLLHSSISTNDQNRVFDALPDGIRKIILSTNIAETSITISDVIYVIDSGKVKEQLFDAVSNTNCLRTNWISQTSAVQRKGRAGRVKPGECYRLFSKSRFSNMLKYQTAEILRCPLEELCLHTKLLAPITSSIADFLSKAVEPPPQLVIKNAVNILKQMDALDKFEDLTDLGCHLAELPVPPHCGKMVLMSTILKCLDPILTIASFLSYKEPFVLPTSGEGKRKLSSIKERFAKDSFSDHIAYLEFYQGYMNAKENRQERIFCYQNCFSYAVMQIVEGTRDHLKRHLTAIGFLGPETDMNEMNVNSDKWPVVRAVLVSALFPKLAVVDRTNGTISTRLEKRVRCHPSSVLNSASQVNSKSHKDIVKSLPYNWLIFDEMTRFNTLALIKGCSVVTSFSVAIMAGPSRLLPHQYHFEADPEQESDDEEECSNDEEKRSNWKPLSNFRFSIDDWLNLYLDNGNASLIVNVRQKLHALIVRKFKTCGKSSTHGDDMVVQTIVQALCSEDQAALNISNFQSRMKLLPPSRKSNFRSDRNESSSSSEERNSSTPGVGGSSSRSSISSSPCLTPDMATVGQSVRYFVLKPPDGQMIDISLTTGSWFASHGTKRVLDNAYKSTGSVILFVSVQGSGHFQGFARMNTTSYNDQGKTKFGIEWLKRREVHFHEVNHLNNPWNDNKNVKISRDGQEIEPMVAQELIEIIERGNDKSRYAKGRNSRRGKKLH